MRKRDPNKHRSTGCERQQPQVRIRLHTPETPPVHRHIDATFRVAAEDDWSLWAKTCAEVLVHMGYTYEPFIIGFLLDLINGFSKEIRWELVKGLFLGWGCEVEPQPDGSVYVRPAQRYEPLGAPEETKSGIILPSDMELEKRTEGGLILP